MKWSNKTIAARSILAPGDMAHRRSFPHVAELANSILALGNEPIHPLTCVKKDRAYHLVAGRDRFAALLNLGIKRVPVRVVEDATPEDLAQVEHDENARRRRLTDAESERLKAAVVEDLTERKAGTVPALQTITAETRKVLAAANGVTPAAIKKREQRARAREEGGGAVGVPAHGEAGRSAERGDRGTASPEHTGSNPDTAPPPPIECYGHALPDDVRQLVTPIVETLRKVDQLLRQAQGLVNAMTAPCDLEPADKQQLAEALHAMAVLVRGKTPTHLCPYCLGKKPSSKCPACKRLGAVPRNVFDAAPAERRAPNGPGSANLQATLATPPRVLVPRAQSKRAVRVVMPGETEPRAVDEVLAEVAKADDDEGLEL